MRSNLGALRLTRTIGLCAFLFVDWTARAENRPAPVSPSVPRPEPNSFIDAIDRYHDAACSYVLGFGEGMDGWLAKRFRDPTRPAKEDHPPLVYDLDQLVNADGSRIVVSPIIDFREADGASLGLKVSGKLKLPRLSERLDLVFDSDYDETDLTPELTKARDVGLRSGDDGAASLRLRLDDNLKIKPSIEAGLKFKPEPVPRIGLKLRLANKNPEFTTRATQTFFWEREDGWGERTTFDVERGAKDEYLARLGTSLLWSEGSDGVRAGQTLQLYRFLSHRRAMGVKFGVYGPLEPSAYIETYSARLAWRQRVHRDWLFLEIEPGIDWPRDRDYEATPLVQVKLDIIFGDWVEKDDASASN